MIEPCRSEKERTMIEAHELAEIAESELDQVSGGKGAGIDPDGAPAP